MNGGLNERKKKRKEEETVVAASVRTSSFLHSYIHTEHTQLLSNAVFYTILF